MAQKTPRPPAGLRVSGRALWRALMTEYELDEHETALLREACRTASIDLLQAVLDNDGVMSESSQGLRAHPALTELRQQRVTFARLLTALRIPQGEADGRAQVRGTTRGVYSIGGGAS